MDTEAIKISGQDTRLSFHINPARPIRARDPDMSVVIVETIKGLEFPHIVRASKGVDVFKYTVDGMGYRYPNQCPSPFDVENTTRPNSFAEAQELAAPVSSRPVPASDDTGNGDADEF